MERERVGLASARVKKDLAELSLERFNCTNATTSIEFPKAGRNQLRVRLRIAMSAGFWSGGAFGFHLDIPGDYPFHAPAVTCTTRLWHPNVETSSGVVHLPVLGKDWRPVLSINTVIFALQLMFLEPCVEHAVNREAAAGLMDPETFRTELMRSSLRHPIRIEEASSPPLHQVIAPVPAALLRRPVPKRKLPSASAGCEEADLKSDLEAMCIQDEDGGGMFQDATAASSAAGCGGGSASKRLRSEAYHEYRIPQGLGQGQGCGFEQAHVHQHHGLLGAPQGPGLGCGSGGHYGQHGVPPFAPPAPPPLVIVPAYRGFGFGGGSGGHGPTS